MKPKPKSFALQLALISLTALSFGAVALPIQDKPQAVKPPVPLYDTRLSHDPDGIGKFFMGREIAQVMGHLGAEWLERPEREQEEAPGLLMKALKLKPGMVVADIGAGSGYFTFRMAKEVSPGGEVYAVDIQEEMLTIIRRRMQQLKDVKVKPVLGTIMDPKLPANSVDLMLMVDVYHEFSHPYEMINAMVKALKPGGKIVFVEYRLEDPNVPIKLVHKMSQKQVVKEMALFSLKLVENSQVLPRQHIFVFQKPGGPAK